MNRIRLGKQVIRIADQYGISRASVYSIIECYLRYCKDLLVQGNRVDFYGLVSIVPDYEVSKMATTLAYECEKVAKVLCLPSHTAYVILNAYIEDAIDAVKSGTIVEIRGIVTIKPILDMNGIVVTVHSSISQMLKGLLDENSFVTSFRVHTYKHLRKSIKGGVVI